MSTEAVERDILIRAPRPEDWPACRMLLSELFKVGGEPEVRLAIACSSPRIVGAIGWRMSGRFMYGTRVRVVRNQRRQGLGTKLVRAMIGEGRGCGAETVICPVETLTEPDAGPFLTSLGFERSNGLTRVEADISEMLKKLRILRKRLESKRTIPDEASFVFLPEASKRDVARFYAAQLAHDADLPVPAIAKMMERGLLDNSVVLTIDGQVQGILLLEMKEQLGIVHARAVAPEFQRAPGWANAMLMALAIERGDSLGGTRVQYDLPEGNRDTTKLVNRMAASVLWVRDQYTLKLT